ncbi:hypothetical protein RB195_014497 [Necator americanus]|uniref:Uncharacterized protein n=1 Tax=Necator americanus TaxID=51031 RepID=A0ABR1E0H6_NECAM
MPLRYGATRSIGQYVLNFIEMAYLKGEECGTNFRHLVSIHVGAPTRKKLCCADSFTKCIQDSAKETLPVQMRPKKPAFAYAETRSMYNSVCVTRSNGDLNQEKRLSRKLLRQLYREWTSRTKKFEKAWSTRTAEKPMLY